MWLTTASKYWGIGKFPKGAFSGGLPPGHKRNPLRGVQEMSKEKIDVEKMAKRIRGEYDYMDSLPLEGWMWEITRRTRKYHDFFKEAETLSRNFGDVKYLWFKDKAREVFNGGLVRVSIPENDRGRQRSKIVYEPYYICIRLPFDVGENARATLVPKPSTRYVDFQLSGVLYHIRGSVPYRAALWREVNWFLPRSLPHSLKPFRLEEDSNLYVDTMRAPPYWYDGNMINHVTIGSNEETIYIGISKKAKMADIEEGLLPIIKQYLEPVQQRIRLDKWKYYIVAYDLHEAEKMVYRRIADIFNKAYRNPQKTFTYYDEKDIARYHSEAVMLIEKDGYRKYLFEPVFDEPNFARHKTWEKYRKEWKKLDREFAKILRSK